LPRKCPLGIEADPIIADLQQQRFTCLAKKQVHLAGASVLDRVVQRLLCDAIEFLLGAVRRSGRAHRPG
jgi:hypothetical protein